MRQTVRIETLKNAVEHDGQASVDAVMKKVMSQSDEDAETIIEVVKEEVSNVNNTDKDGLVSELRDKEPSFFDDESEGDKYSLPELPNATKGEVRMRAAPNPNGFWHLGHARMPSVLGTYSSRYDGEMIVRFDDTDPVNKRPKIEAYNQIIDDIEYLGFKPSEVVYASDRMSIYYKYARKLIDLGVAYTCWCSSDKMSDNRRSGDRCSCYDNSSNDRKIFEQMVNGRHDSGDVTLRIATDINHKNPAVRDWVAFRILDANHPRDLEDNYSLWPTLDFQSAIDDHKLDITHIIRGIDLQDSEKRQKYIYEALEWDYPEVLHWGRISVDEYDVPLSSSSINELISDGTIEGWNDPKAPTISSLRRRGIEGEAIVESMLSLGLSTNDATLSMSEIYTRNREVVDSNTPRAFFVADAKKNKFAVHGGPEVAELPTSPDSTNSRSVRVGSSVWLPDEALVNTGERVWLKGVGCFKRDGDELLFVSEDTELVEDGEVPVGYWVSTDDNVEVDVIMKDGTVMHGHADRTVDTIQEGNLIRFGLVGFANLDNKGDKFRFVLSHD